MLEARIRCRCMVPEVERAAVEPVEITIPMQLPVRQIREAVEVEAVEETVHFHRVLTGQREAVVQLCWCFLRRHIPVFESIPRFSPIADTAKSSIYAKAIW